MSKKISKKIVLVAGVLAIFCLLVGYATGRRYKTYEVAQEKQSDMSMMDHSNMAGMDMEHDKISVAANRINPKVKLVATKDMMSGISDGYNLNIQTQAFSFTPQNAGAEAVQNTGHAHVFINGVKIGRAYGPWYFLNNTFLKTGTNTVTVILNSNNHAEWIAKDGTEISSTLELVK